MRNWIKNFDCFLFDFDGLLVDTEKIHYEAFRLFCKNLGKKLPWDFKTYCTIAHFTSNGLCEGFYKLYPDLRDKYPSWDLLYLKKKLIYLDLLKKRVVQLMEGTEELLSTLKHVAKKRCVVTHSTKEQVEYIKERLPILKTIPMWITREDYENSKPAPDGYLKALECVKASDDKVVGFEDTLRGVRALQAAAISHPVLISPVPHPQLIHAFHFSSLSVVHFDEEETMSGGCSRS